MEDIKYIEKPDSISWDDIHNVLLAAHQQNINSGMPMRYALLSGEELKDHIGDDGRCFVALDGNKLIGVSALKITRQKRWYTKNKIVAYLSLGSILPEYQGRGIYEQLFNMRQNVIDQLPVDIIEMETAEHNKPIQHLMLKKGFKYIGFKNSGTGKFYYVVMVKWTGTPPYPDCYIKARYLLRKFMVKTRYKPGGEKRFGI